MEITILESSEKQFLALKTRQDVADILDIKDRSLRYFLFKRRPENLYKTFKIPKGSDGFREINAPIDELKSIQRKLACILNEVYNPKVCAYGFVNGKNIVQNAKIHVGRQLVLNIDLKVFLSETVFSKSTYTRYASDQMLSTYRNEICRSFMS